MTFIKYLPCYAVTVHISVTVCRNLKQRVIASYNSVMIRLIPMHRCSNCISSFKVKFKYYEVMEEILKLTVKHKVRIEELEKSGTDISVEM